MLLAFGERLPQNDTPRLAILRHVLLPIAVLHDETGIVVFLDGPGRREAAGCHG
jgi:hypothetical protein